MTPNIASAIQTKFDAGSCAGSGRKLSHTNVAPVADPSTDRTSATNAALRGNHRSRSNVPTPTIYVVWTTVAVFVVSLVLTFVSPGVEPSGHEWDDLNPADQGPQKL